MKPILISMAACCLLSALAIAQSPRYTVTDLGTLGGAGTNSNAFGLNDTGWVAGSRTRSRRPPTRLPLVWRRPLLPTSARWAAGMPHLQQRSERAERARRDGDWFGDLPDRSERRRLLWLWHSPSMPGGNRKNGVLTAFPPCRAATTPMLFDVNDARPGRRGGGERHSRCNLRRAARRFRFFVLKP